VEAAPSPASSGKTDANWTRTDAIDPTASSASASVNTPGSTNGGSATGAPAAGAPGSGAANAAPTGAAAGAASAKGVAAADASAARAPSPESGAASAEGDKTYTVSDTTATGGAGANAQASDAPGADAPVDPTAPAIGDANASPAPPPAKTTEVSATVAAPAPPASTAPAAVPGPSAPPAVAPPKPTFNAPVDPAALQDPNTAPPTTTIIPPAVQSAPQVQPEAAGQGAESNAQIINYEANQAMPLTEPQLHSLQEFMSEGVNASPLGLELQEGQRRAHNGRRVDGLLVVAVQPGSPAERAGVQSGHRVAHDVLEGAAVAASLVFPPAVLAVPVIETIQIGENYDLIIGVDGNRVSNFLDFQDQLRDAQPGETVYLNVLRDGRRIQVPLQMPPATAANLYP